MCVTVKVYYSFFSSNSAYFKTENVSKAKTQWKKITEKTDNETRMENFLKRKSLLKKYTYLCTDSKRALFFCVPPPKLKALEC